MVLWSGFDDKQRRTWTRLRVSGKKNGITMGLTLEQPRLVVATTCRKRTTRRKRLGRCRMERGARVGDTDL